MEALKREPQEEVGQAEVNNQLEADGTTWWMTEEWDQELDKAILHQDLFLTPAVGSPPSLWLKQEPLCAVFVGPEPPGTGDHRRQFVDNATAAAYTHHHQPTTTIAAAAAQWPHHSHQQQQHGFWTEQQPPIAGHHFLDSPTGGGAGFMPPFDETAVDGDDNFFQPHFHHQPPQLFEQYQQQQQQEVESPMGEDCFQLADISTSTISGLSASVSGTSAASEMASMFEPLSVCSSACTWSSGGTTAGEENSSQSQDEILEEIQRECAEIERRSFSRSPSSPEQPQSSNNSSQKPRAKAAGGGRKRKSEQPRKGREERKKALNRVAATRYREKKRKEREEIAGVMELLQARNRQLRADIAAVQTEMNYLKGLAKEIEAARRRVGGK